MENNPKLRDLYDTFLDSGELESVLPEATGIWDKDKTLFSSIYSNLDESLLHLIDEEEDEEDFFIDEEYF
jgi:hypothetical protein